MTIPDAVCYFGTCLIDLFKPRAGLAGMDLISRAGVKVRFPRDQTCCGQPPFNSGFRAEARAVARQQMACFNDAIPIVVPSGSCAGMVKHHWCELFAGQPDEAEARAVAGRIYELTEFLVDVLDLRLSDLGEPVCVAVHTSCSARREMGVADKIERLLAQLAQVKLVEPDHKAECCGFGGTFAVKQPDISGAMVNDKTRAILATQAEVLVSQDYGCLMNIEGALRKQGGGPRAVHIAQFLMERTDGPSD